MLSLLAQAVSSEPDSCSFGALAFAFVLIAVGIASLAMIVVEARRYAEDASSENPLENVRTKRLVGGAAGLIIALFFWFLFFAGANPLGVCFAKGTLSQEETTPVGEPFGEALPRPRIDILGENPAEVFVGSTYKDAGAVASSHAHGDLTDEIKTQGLPLRTDTPGTRVVVYYVADDNGNFSQAERTVFVVELKRKSSSLFDGVGDGSATAPSLTPPALSPSELFPTPPPTPSAPPQDSEIDTPPTSPPPSSPPSAPAEEGEAGEPLASTATDGSYLRSCYGRAPTGLCERTDTNRSGTINRFDEDFLINLLTAYDVNGDAIIERALGEPIMSCFFKINGTCAFEQYGDTVITRSYLLSLDDKLTNSPASGFEEAIDLGSFKGKLGSGTLDTIAYATVAQYDLNNDGVMDISTGEGNEDIAIVRSCAEKAATGSCEIADINKDGWVTLWDLMFVDTIQSILLPESFTIEQFEWVLFDVRTATDARIVKHCAEKGLLVGNCERTDVNGDGAVDQKDIDLFTTTTAYYDFNGDFVINGGMVF